MSYSVTCVWFSGSLSSVQVASIRQAVYVARHMVRVARSNGAIAPRAYIGVADGGSPAVVVRDDGVVRWWFSSFLGRARLAGKSVVW